MSDIYSILKSNYTTVGAANYSRTPYIAVEPKLYQGTWSGAYSDNTKFTVQVSNVDGFRAKVRYQSGSTLQYQDVLIKDFSFKFGDSKFTLSQDRSGQIIPGQAQIKTVNETKGTLETAYANQDIPIGSS
jgi:hypothetical protein